MKSLTICGILIGTIVLSLAMGWNLTAILLCCVSFGVVAKLDFNE